jgi:hypothetical protein
MNLVSISFNSAINNIYSGEANLETVPQGPSPQSILSSLVLWHPLARFLQGLALLCVDFRQTFARHFSCLRVGHTEYVICLDSPVHAAIAWNWISQRLDRLGCGHAVNAEECGISTSLILGDGNDPK